jgi:predicted transporter
MTESAFAGGIPFIIAGILFAADIFRKNIHVCLPSSGWLRYAVIAMVVWGLGLYTLAGWLSGHSYPGGPLPSAPCPATITAIALLLSSVGTLEKDRVSFILLFAMLIWWSFYAGLGASVIYGFYVDLTLFAAGLFGFAVLVNYLKKDKNEG